VYGLEPEFRATSLVLGSAIHSAIGWWFEQRLEGKAPTLVRAQDILVADLLAGETLSPVRWKTATPESLEDEARRLLHLYLTEHGDLPVAEVEQEFQADLVDPETGEAFGRPMKGYFDLALEDRAVIEIKTSGRTWNDADLVRHLQVGAYAFAWNAMHGGPCEVQIHVIVKLKREPRVDVFRIYRGEPATRWWIQAASAIERAIESRSFPPSPGPLCHECPFDSACAGWLDEEPVVVEPKQEPRIPHAARLRDEAMTADF
jgi:CRISPR/Cas system-associated exonuclease Cas4 (RecB family)